MKDGFKMALGGFLSLLAVVFAVVAKVSLPILVVLFVLKLAGMVSIGWATAVLVPVVSFVLATFLNATCIVLAKVCIE